MRERTAAVRVPTAGPAKPAKAAKPGKPEPAPRPARSAAARAVQAHREGDGDALFGIAELCAEFGITQRALRFYEDKGLIAPRRVNGARVYTRRDRARLALVLRSKAIGASLDDIRHFLDLYGTHGEGRKAQWAYVLERTGGAIAELEAKRSAIDSTLAELRLIHDEARTRLAAPAA